MVLSAVKPFLAPHGDEHMGGPTIEREVERLFSMIGKYKRHTYCHREIFHVDMAEGPDGTKLCQNSEFDDKTMSISLDVKHLPRRNDRIAFIDSPLLSFYGRVRNDNDLLVDLEKQVVLKKADVVPYIETENPS